MIILTYLYPFSAATENKKPRRSAAFVILYLLLPAFPAVDNHLQIRQQLKAHSLVKPFCALVVAFDLEPQAGYPLFAFEEEETLLDTAEKDEEITEYILEEMENLQEQIDNKDDNNIKKSAKKLFITLIDFIFFDKEIKGVTYNELSEGVKQQLYDELCTINTLIDQYLPDTKESISETYNAYKKYLTPYYYDFIDTIKSYIGEENLKDLKDLKDNLGEDLYSFYTKKKAKLKEKYQNWKEE